MLKPNAKNLKIKFQQRKGKPKYSIDKRTILLQFFVTFSNKNLLLECILPICNNFSEQNYLDKLVFNNVSRLNLPRLMNNTVINKINYSN